MRHLRAASFLTVVSLFLSVLFVSTASAATANGRCSSAGQAAKIGGKNYVCAQNPTVKSKALRWTLKDCLRANTAYLTSVKSLAETESSNAKILETIDASIKSLEAQLPVDKERAVTEDANAKRNRALAEDKTKEAETKLAAAKAAGIADIPSTWTSQLQAAIIDRQLSAFELSSLARSWNLTTDQASLAIQYLSLQIQINQYVRAAERHERNVASYLKTEQTLKNVVTQRQTTVETQQDLMSIAQGDVKSTLKVRNASCRTK